MLPGPASMCEQLICMATSIDLFVHVVELDLRKRSTWSFLEHLARSRRPFHFHAAIMRHSFESERCRSCGRSTWAPTTAFRRLPHGISVANWFLERQSRICKFDLYPPCGLLFLVEFSSDWVEHREPWTQLPLEH